jgi:hypothetical protein
MGCAVFFSRRLAVTLLVGAAFVFICSAILDWESGLVEVLAGAGIILGALSSLSNLSLLFGQSECLWITVASSACCPVPEHNFLMIGVLHAK